MNYRDRLLQKLKIINNKITDLKFEKMKYQEMIDELGDMSLVDTVSQNIEDLKVERDVIKKELSYVKA